MLSDWVARPELQAKGVGSRQTRPSRPASGYPGSERATLVFELLPNDLHPMTTPNAASSPLLPVRIERDPFGAA